MRKPLYNIVIFIFHIITLILLFTLCIHFNVIKLDFLDFSKIMYNNLRKLKRA